MSDDGYMQGQGYMHGQDGNLLAEGLGQGARGAAEAAAVLMMAAQMYARIRQQQADAQVLGDERETQRRQDQLRAEHTRARTQWELPAQRELAMPATDREALAVWSSAQPWRAHDPAAEDASRRAEERLEALHPDLMAEYRANRERGMEPPEAMLDAAHHVASRDYEAFLPPEPMRGIDPKLYAVESNLGVDDTLRAWDAARPWAVRYDDASEAMSRAEDHLRELRPVAMQDYDDRRAAGQSPEEAMRAVLPQMRGPGADEGRDEAIAAGTGRSSAVVLTPEESAAYMADHPRFAEQVERRSREVAEQYGYEAGGVDVATDRVTELVGQSYPQALGTGNPGAAEAALTVAGEQRLEAAQALDTPDNRATPQDEHTQGQTSGADHLEYADASAARGAGLASSSFPKPLQGSLTARTTVRSSTHTAAPSPAPSRRR